MCEMQEELKLEYAQLCIVDKADVWLRDSELLQDPLPWPVSCQLVCDRFTDSGGYSGYIKNTLACHYSGPPRYRPPTVNTEMPIKK